MPFWGKCLTCNVLPFQFLLPLCLTPWLLGFRCQVCTVEPHLPGTVHWTLSIRGYSCHGLSPSSFPYRYGIRVQGCDLWNGTVWLEFWTFPFWAGKYVLTFWVLGFLACKIEWRWLMWWSERYLLHRVVMRIKRVNTCDVLITALRGSWPLQAVNLHFS